MSLKAQGVTQETLDTTVDRMAELAYEDHVRQLIRKNH